MPQTDVLIIGSGLAALSAAYYLKNKQVTVLTKSSWIESNSMLAQGGIAAAIGPNDSWQSHYQDTIEAGCFHNQENNVALLVQEGSREILDWVERGMTFDVDVNGRLLLSKEGAHHHNRIVHAGGDATGREITQFLYKKVCEKAHIVEDEMAVDLLVDHNQCIGVVTKNKEGKLTTYTADYTIIASGGCGAVYGHTSNAHVITGDGIAMAYRAGAKLSDMEFIQFHPTMLYQNGKCIGLISEAVRGEGAILKNQLGERFMKEIHELGDLAPRDIVSRAIFDEMKNGNSVYLDITRISHFENRFPTITKMCLDNGINLEKGWIPVAPGMHFLMGGIQTNEHGETNVPHLLAVGEAACTGVHGANRLASNSLLEGLVFGKRVAEFLSTKLTSSYSSYLKESLDQYREVCNVELPTKEQIQDIMTNYVGILRTQSELEYAVKWFESYQKRNFWDFNVKDFTIEQIERLNMVTIGWIISMSALKRTESRGGHFRKDYPTQNNDYWKQRQVICCKDDIHVGV
ncbi:L-aspartate oxidase [Metabacillus sp. HB246100]|uniref:L-aspartate oxidase n=1 Tax=Bacillus weihaiensis TaxID=1547283 RepID=UPI002355228F|nr:L-aspartate oxidase [Bacillus weihaiensis]